MSEETLKEQFLQATGVAAQGEACPTPERIWEAVRLEHRSSEFGALLDHVAACPACAIAWRLARDFGAEAMPSGVLPFPGAVASRRWIRFAAAAAAVLVAGFAIDLLWERQPPPAFRTSDESAIRSLIPEERPLPREAVVLRWSVAGPEGTRFTLRVLDEDLRLLASAGPLEQPEYRIPVESLKPLPAGATFLWQVDAVFPDGRRQTSMTFLARLE